MSALAPSGSVADYTTTQQDNGILSSGKTLASSQKENCILDMAAWWPQQASEIHRLGPNSLGVWTLDGKIGVGFVALLETLSGEIILIRKSFRESYEFSGQLALPGGMVRSTQGESDEFSKSLKHSMQNRLDQETGIPFSSLPPLEYYAFTPITSYTAKGSRRYTLVLPFKGKIPDQLPLTSKSSSVEEPQWWHWQKIIAHIDQLAPANRLILVAYLQNRLSPKEIRSISAAVREARNLCNTWAENIGWQLDPEPPLR